MDPDCGDTFAWYKKVCLDLPYRPNIDDYECPDFVSKLSMDDMNAMSDDEIESLSIQYHLTHMVDARKLRAAIYDHAYMDDLMIYVAELEKYAKKAVICAEAREAHFRKCIYNTAEEDKRHHEWRVAFSDVAERCRDTLLYWKEVYDDMADRVLESRIAQLRRNQKRRDKAKLVRPRVERPSPRAALEKPDDDDRRRVDAQAPTVDRRRVKLEEAKRVQAERRREEQRILDVLERERIETDRAQTRACEKVATDLLSGEK